MSTKDPPSPPLSKKGPFSRTVPLGSQFGPTFSGETNFNSFEESLNKGKILRVAWSSSPDVHFVADTFFTDSLCGSYKSCIDVMFSDMLPVYIMSQVAPPCSHNRKHDFTMVKQYPPLLWVLTKSQIEYFLYERVLSFSKYRLDSVSFMLFSFLCSFRMMLCLHGDNSI